jgi:hypothetical protein
MSRAEPLSIRVERAIELRAFRPALVSSVFSGRMLQVCLFRCCICFTHTLHVFYLNVAYGCTGSQKVFSGVLFKCSRSMFEVFQLFSDLYYTRCIWMFQK